MSYIYNWFSGNSAALEVKQEENRAVPSQQNLHQKPLQDKISLVVTNTLCETIKTCLWKYGLPVLIEQTNLKNKYIAQAGLTLCNVLKIKAKDECVTASTLLLEYAPFLSTACTVLQIGAVLGIMLKVSKPKDTSWDEVINKTVSNGCGFFRLQLVKDLLFAPYL